MAKSRYFEQKIYRIHQILEPDGSIIKWDDKITDPDNPKRTRQIDISIKNGDKTTHIECRIHNGKQDVKWIEELHGRRISLNIDKIIAVSSSGFTKGALIKAKRFKIKTYSLRKLNESHIKKLKPKIIVTIFKFYEFLSFKIYVYFDWLDKKYIRSISIKDTFERKGIVNRIFNIIGEHLKKMIAENVTFIYNQTIYNHNEEWNINNIKIERLEIRAVVKTFNKEFKVEVIEQYNIEAMSKIKEEAILETNQGFEIIKTNQNVSITFDQSKIHIPSNCLLDNRPIVGLGSMFTIKRLHFIDSQTRICMPILEFHPIYVHKQPLFLTYKLF